MNILIYALLILNVFGIECKDLENKNIDEIMHKITDLDTPDSERPKPLGKGAYGAVYTLTEDKVLKVSSIPPYLSEENTRIKYNLATNEIVYHKDIQKLLYQHQNVVPLLYQDCEFKDEGRNLHIVVEMQKCQQTLLDIVGHPDVKMKRVRELLMQAANLLAFINENNFVHHDTHPGNFMLCDGMLKLIDLGYAEDLTDDQTKIEIRKNLFIEVETFWDACVSKVLFSGDKKDKIYSKNVKALYAKNYEKKMRAKSITMGDIVVLLGTKSDVLIKDNIII